MNTDFRFRLGRDAFHSVPIVPPRSLGRGWNTSLPVSIRVNPGSSVVKDFFALCPGIGCNLGRVIR
jgi:hypothetical protein